MDEMESNLNIITINENMTKEEQLEISLKNNVVLDRINELYKDEDLEAYHEHLENKQQSFEEIYNVKQVKAIFYEVETDAGTKYYVDSHETFTGIWNFEEVSKSHFDNIA